MALESINTITAQCEAHSPSLVRFAQQFGYSGFKQLQAVFQTRLAAAAPGFRERISALEADLSRTVGHGNLGFLRDLVVRDIATLHRLLLLVDLANAEQWGSLQGPNRPQPACPDSACLEDRSRRRLQGINIMTGLGMPVFRRVI